MFSIGHSDNRLLHGQWYAVGSEPHRDFHQEPCIALLNKPEMSGLDNCGVAHSSLSRHTSTGKTRRMSVPAYPKEKLQPCICRHEKAEKLDLNRNYLLELFKKELICSHLL